jgi:hypothetical protein
MSKNQKLSRKGKKYCLKHINLIRDFCFACKQATAKGDFDQAKYYKNWAHRIIKGINPFCKTLEEQDRKFLSNTKKQLDSVLTQTESYFNNIQTNRINNIMKQLIVNTIDIEGNVL